MSEDKPAVTRTRGQLAPTDPDVEIVATRMGWRGETLLARLTRALPEVVEQELFLAIIPHMAKSMTPEKFADLLCVASPQPLRLDDLRTRTVGRNLAISRIDHIGDYLQASMELLGKLTGDLETSLSVDQAGRLALVFGDGAMDLIEQIQENQAAVASALGYRESYRFAEMAHAAVEHLLRYVASGRPNPVNIMEIFGRMDEAFRDSGEEMVSNNEVDDESWE